MQTLSLIKRLGKFYSSIDQQRSALQSKENLLQEEAEILIHLVLLERDLGVLVANLDGILETFPIDPEALEECKRSLSCFLNENSY